MKPRPPKAFLCSYYNGGGWISHTIYAYNWKDAERRAENLGMRLDGELMMTIPARFGWFARAVVWIRNLLT